MNITLRGTISLEGFESPAEASQYISNGGAVEIVLYHCIPAGLHPDGSVTIKRKEKPNGLT